MNITHFFKKNIMQLLVYIGKSREESESESFALPLYLKTT